jgi:hypothetical protein
LIPLFHDGIGKSGILQRGNGKVVGNEAGREKHNHISLWMPESGRKEVASAE